MIPIEVTNGEENPVSGSFKCIVMRIHHGLEGFISDAANNTPGYSKIADPQFSPALAGFQMKIGGRWVDQTYIVPEGAILKVMASRKMSVTDKGKNACILLKAREKGPLIRVVAETLRIPNVSTRAEVTCVKGRFDVITLPDAMREGFKTLFPASFNPVIRDSMFRVEVLEPEIKSKETYATVTTASGGTAHVRQRTRNVEI